MGERCVQEAQTHIAQALGKDTCRNIKASELKSILDKVSKRLLPQTVHLYFVEEGDDTHNYNLVKILANLRDAKAILDWLVPLCECAFATQKRDATKFEPVVFRSSIEDAETNGLLVPIWFHKELVTRESTNTLTTTVIADLIATWDEFVVEIENNNTQFDIAVSPTLFSTWARVLNSVYEDSCPEALSVPGVWFVRQRLENAAKEDKDSEDSSSWESFQHELVTSAGRAITTLKLKTSNQMSDYLKSFGVEVIYTFANECRSHANVPAICEALDDLLVVSRPSKYPLSTVNTATASINTSRHMFSRMMTSPMGQGCISLCSREVGDRAIESKMERELKVMLEGSSAIDINEMENMIGNGDMISSKFKTAYKQFKDVSVQYKKIFALLPEKLLETRGQTVLVQAQEFFTGATARLLLAQLKRFGVEHIRMLQACTEQVLSATSPSAVGIDVHCNKCEKMLEGIVWKEITPMDDDINAANEKLEFLRTWLSEVMSGVRWLAGETTIVESEYTVAFLQRLDTMTPDKVETLFGSKENDLSTEVPFVSETCFHPQFLS